MIDLYTANTPNGLKIAILLAELDQPHTMHRMALGGTALQAPWYRAINPNARIPAIVDRRDPAAPVTLFESGAILLHLATLAGRFLGESPTARAQTLSWLFLQVAGLGPAMGTAGALGRQQLVDDPVLQRFRSEALRLFGVLEGRLAERPWLNGEGYSIADIAHFSWLRRADYAGLSLAGFPAIAAWIARIEARDAVGRAIAGLAD